MVLDVSQFVVDDDEALPLVHHCYCCCTAEIEADAPSFLRSEEKPRGIEHRKHLLRAVAFEI